MRSLHPQSRNSKPFYLCIPEFNGKVEQINHLQHQATQKLHLSKKTPHHVRGL